MSIRSRALAVAAVAAAALLAAPTADAQRRRRPRAEEPGPASPTPEREARAHFETGVALYEEQNYEGALAEFEESYRLRAVPIVLFNIGQSQRRLLRYAEAVESFERYLAEAGADLAPERRAAVQATIAQLRSSLGTLVIESDPPGAEVRVDGRAAGTTPRAGLALSAGRHAIELVHEGFVPVREEVTVVARRTREVRFRLAARSSAAEIAVEARPRGARVAIDGIDVGVAPVMRRLSAGGHRVEVRATGHEPYAGEIVLAERQRRTLRVDLAPPAPLTSRWYFWAGVGGVLAAGLAVSGYFLLRPGQPEPIPGTGDPPVIFAVTAR